MRTLLITVVAVLGTGFPTVAQCPVQGVTFSPYGSGCSGPFPNHVPTLGGGWWTNPRGCGISLWMDSYRGCCSTSLDRQILVFGLAPMSIPIPGMGRGCTLLTAPTLVLSYGGSTRVLSRALPPGTGLGSVYVQGVLEYHTAITHKRSYALSQAMKVTLR